MAYAQLLHRRGDFGGAVRTLEIKKGVANVDLMRCLMLPELPDGLAAATKLHEEIAARPDLGGWEASTAARKGLIGRPRVPWSGRRGRQRRRAGRRHRPGPAGRGPRPGRRRKRGSS
jgi:hypothetical protein